MSRHSSMQVLVNLAEHRSEEAVRDLSQLIMRGAQSESKLQLLRGYLAEYRTRLDHAVREGLDSERLRNYLAFISRLERAIADQVAEVEKDKARIDAGKRRWQEEERQRRTYETLVERRQAAGRQAEAQAQQKQNDEFATRVALRPAAIPR